MSLEANKKLAYIMKEVREALSEQFISEDGISAEVPVKEPSKPKKATKVLFDKSTNLPFEVIFSERGFLIEDTRLSFEELQTAISKNYNIVLNGGSGLSLDAVKMQKILKYKDIY